MGYEKQGADLLTFHHLIVPRRFCQDMEDKGYNRDNGAILFTTPHQYLHVIEVYDREMFEIITDEMKDINNKGYLDSSNIRYIDDCLKSFEKEHCSSRTSKGKLLIKDSYLYRHFK